MGGQCLRREKDHGPNQRWCWDISYLHTYERSVFLYLYLLLDEYSRKAIHWLISWRQRAEDAQQLLEGGLLAENILDCPEEQRPEIVNDRGRQMKARSIRTIFELHGMPQLFAGHEPPTIILLWSQRSVPQRRRRDIRSIP